MTVLCRICVLCILTAIVAINAVKSRVPHTMTSHSFFFPGTLRDRVDVYFVGFIVRHATVRSSGIFHRDPETGNIIGLMTGRISILAEATYNRIIIYRQWRNGWEAVDIPIYYILNACYKTLRSEMSRFPTYPLEDLSLRFLKFNHNKFGQPFYTLLIIICVYRLYRQIR